jgi:hypothetical protein
MRANILERVKPRGLDPDEITFDVLVGAITRSATFIRTNITKGAGTLRTLPDSAYPVKVFPISLLQNVPPDLQNSEVSIDYDTLQAAAAAGASLEQRHKARRIQIEVLGIPEERLDPLPELPVTVSSPAEEARPDRVSVDELRASTGMTAYAFDLVLNRLGLDSSSMQSHDGTAVMGLDTAQLIRDYRVGPPPRDYMQLKEIARRGIRATLEQAQAVIDEIEAEHGRRFYANECELGRDGTEVRAYFAKGIARDAIHRLQVARAAQLAAGAKSSLHK